MVPIRKNCWEVNQCGREPGGNKAAELGVCRSALVIGYDGSNTGTNAGRCCWQVSGSLSGNSGECVHLPYGGTCYECNFFKRVRYEEGGRFRL